MVRGRLTRPRGEELLSFWFARGALSGEEARDRLPEVVCLLRREGAVAGASSVYPADMELIGGRRFWIYRSLLDRVAADQAPAMIRATFSALEAEFDGAPGSPVGLCVLLGDPDERRRRPQAEWPDPRMIYAGYLGDGRQVRIAYFHGALIAPPEAPGGERPAQQASPLRAGYRLVPFDQQDEVSGEDVVELWTQEGVLGPVEAKRRLSEVVIVATDTQHRPAGIATTYLQHDDQLRASMWYTRTFVAKAHRGSFLSGPLARAATAYLAERFASGEDRRGMGVLFEMESEVLRRARPHAISPGTDGMFIGEDARGVHIRVCYFPGALAPEPPGAAEAPEPPAAQASDSAPAQPELT